MIMPAVLSADFADDADGRAEHVRFCFPSSAPIGDADNQSVVGRSGGLGRIRDMAEAVTTDRPWKAACD